MRLHYDLNLPNILNSTAVHYIMDNWSDKSYNLYNFFEPKKILEDNILSIFERMCVYPYTVIVFRKEQKMSETFDSRVLHRDIRFDENLQQWVSLPCAINFELFDTKTIWKWFDVDKLQEIHPDKNEHQHDTLKKLNGVHYRSRINRGLHHNLQELGEKIIHKTPVLLRTDIHHISSYTGNQMRMGLSVRFDNLPWDEAVAKFLPYISTKTT